MFANVRWSTFLILIALIMSLLATVARAQSNSHVDMLLCLAADVSESVTKDEYRLQREGHASAIKDPDVVDIIKGGAQGRIAAIYVEWARQDQQFAGADWHVIDDLVAAQTFSREISDAPMPPWIEAPVRNTSTGEAVLYCLKQFERAPVTASKKVIDISSDGTSNIGAEIAAVRDRAVRQGVTINVLAITGSKNPFPHPTHEFPTGGLEKYFEQNVVGGRGGFVKVAAGYESFSQMIKRKFVLELASLR